MVIDLYVLNNVSMTLKPLARLLDTLLGHRRSHIGKVPLSTIWLEIGILTDFEVLING
jgi:hypothetical protein